jgi:hypothetical protein
MKYIVVFFLLFLSFQTVAQTEHLKEFYPENKLYRKLKVKAVIDSFMIDPANARIIRYDTSGRKLNSYYYGCPGCASPVHWISNGDTLTCLQFYRDSTHRKLFSREQFIYNKKGEILQHSICYNPFTPGDGVYARINNFFYNSTGLFCKMEYTNHNYPKTVEANMIIAENDLNISSAIYYTYKKTNSGVTIVGRETMGSKDWRTIDTIVYDKANCITRKSSFSKKGTDGERSLTNFHPVKVYSWKGMILTILEFYAYCFAESPQYGCLTTITSDTDKREFIYDKNGLLQAEYSYYPHNGQKYLVSKYYYLFYE